jgi:tetratricopeptide (TPR) repeat protein
MSMTAKSKVYLVGLLVLAFVGAVYLSWTIWAPQYAETRYKQYIELYRQGDLETAVGEINTAIFFDPKNADYYWSRALTYWLLFKEDRSITNTLECSQADWLKAISLKEGDTDWSGWSDVYFGLAQTEFNLGKFRQSINSYQNALQYTSDPVRKGGIAVLLGYIYFTQKDYDSAIQWLDKVPENDKEYVESCVRNALCNHRLHNFKRAEELYLTVLAVLPKNVQVNSYLAHLYAEQGEYTKSVKYLKDGLTQSEDVGSVFDTISVDIYASAEATVYLELFDYFFDHFQDELNFYATGNFPENSPEMRKLNAFYRSVKRVVVLSLDNPNPEVSEYAQALLKKIKQTGLIKL